MDLMRQFDNECIDLTITSPPFYAEDIYILEDGKAEFGWSNYKEYLNHQKDVLAELFRITREGGKICLILTNTPKLDGDVVIGSHPIVFDIYNLATDLGWCYFTELIWNKEDPSYDEGAIHPAIPNSFPVAHHDLILVFVKGEIISRGNNVLKIPSVWTLPSSGPVFEYNDSYSSFPDELIKGCLELWSEKGDVIFDPYAGSGQVVRIALNNDRRALGAEIDPRWQNLWLDIE